MAQEHNCPDCAFRKKYDTNRKSLLGRLWRWHTNWCPGWKAYMASIPDEQRREIAEHYDMKKFMDAPVG